MDTTRNHRVTETKKKVFIQQRKKRTTITYAYECVLTQAFTISALNLFEQLVFF